MLGKYSKDYEKIPGEKMFKLKNLRDPSMFYRVESEATGPYFTPIMYSCMSRRNKVKEKMSPLVSQRASPRRSPRTSSSKDVTSSNRLPHQNVSQRKSREKVSLLVSQRASPKRSPRTSSRSNSLSGTSQRDFRQSLMHHSIADEESQEQVEVRFRRTVLRLLVEIRELLKKVLGEETVEKEEDVIHLATVDAFIKFEQSLEEHEAQKKLVRC